MSFTERVKQKPSRTALCKVGSILDGLPPAEQAAATAMIDDEGWYSKRLSREFTDEGFPVSEDTIRDHRRRECRCFRELHG